MKLEIIELINLKDGKIYYDVVNNNGDDIPTRARFKTQEQAEEFIQSHEDGMSLKASVIDGN